MRKGARCAPRRSSIPLTRIGGEDYLPEHELFGGGLIPPPPGPIISLISVFGVVSRRREGRKRKMHEGLGLPLQTVKNVSPLYGGVTNAPRPIYSLGLRIGLVGEIIRYKLVGTRALQARLHAHSL
jgi:hypothetical protein